MGSAVGVADAPIMDDTRHPAIRATGIILALFCLLAVGILIAAVVSPDFYALVLRYVDIDPRAIFAQIMSLIQQLGRLLH